MRSKIKHYRIYYQLQCKKFLQALPGILLGILLISILLTGFIFVCQKNQEQAEGARTIRLGVSAKENEPYVDWIIDLVEHMESLEFTCQFSKIPADSATKKLQSGELDAVFIIPENYVDSLISGNQEPLVIRLGTSDSTITGFLVRQIGNAASRFMINTQAGIYTLKDHYSENRLSNAEADELDLNLKYLDTIVKRNELVAVEEVDSVQDLSGTAGYFASGIVLFLLFLGLTCPGVLRQESRSLQEKLHFIHIHSTMQTILRYLAFVTVFSGIYLLLALLISVGIPASQTAAVSMASHPGTAVSWFLCFLTILPVVFLACALIQFTYETISNKIVSVLFLFLLILILGYLSGCFYPLSAMPHKIQAIAPFLPLRVMLDHTESCVAGNRSFLTLFSVLSYSALLVAVTVLIRSLSLRRNS